MRRLLWTLSLIVVVVTLPAAHIKNCFALPAFPAITLSSQAQVNQTASQYSKELEDLAAARRSVQKNPASGQAFSSLGVALVGVGDNDGALQAFDRAVHLDPSDAP